MKSCFCLVSTLFDPGQSGAGWIEEQMQREGRKDREGGREDMDRLPEAEVNNILFSALHFCVPTLNQKKKKTLHEYVHS